MSVSFDVEKDTADLERFMNRVAKDEAYRARIVQWHIELYAATEAAYDLPWSGDETYINVNKYKEGDKELDVDAILEHLSAIAKFAVSQGFKVEKEYDYDFSLKIVIADYDDLKIGRTVITYHANREAVCTKRVVSRKLVPAKMTPARMEDVIEWDCEKVSLLAK